MGLSCGLVCAHSPRWRHEKGPRSRDDAHIELRQAMRVFHSLIQTGWRDTNRTHLIFTEPRLIDFCGRVEQEAPWRCRCRNPRLRSPRQPLPSHLRRRRRVVLLLHSLSRRGKRLPRKCSPCVWIAAWRSSELLRSLVPLFCSDMFPSFVRSPFRTRLHVPRVPGSCIII